MMGFVFASSGKKELPKFPTNFSINGYKISVSDEETIIKKEKYPTLEWWFVNDGVYVIVELTQDVNDFDPSSFDWKNTLKNLYLQFNEDKEKLQKELNISLDDVSIIYPYYFISRAEMHDIVRIELGDKPNYDELVKEEINFLKESPKEFMLDFLKLMFFCYCASLHPKISKLGFNEFFKKSIEIFNKLKEGEDISSDFEKFYRELLKKAMRI